MNVFTICLIITIDGLKDPYEISRNKKGLTYILSLLTKPQNIENKCGKLNHRLVLMEHSCHEEYSCKISKL